MTDEASSNTPSSSAPPSLLEQVLVEYLHAVEKGELRNREELLAKYPGLANDLRDFFANRDQMDRLLRPRAG